MAAHLRGWGGFSRRHANVRGVEDLTEGRRGGWMVGRGVGMEGWFGQRLRRELGREDTEEVVGAAVVFSVVCGLVAVGEHNFMVSPVECPRCSRSCPPKMVPDCEGCG